MGLKNDLFRSLQWYFSLSSCLKANWSAIARLNFETSITLLVGVNLFFLKSVAFCIHIWQLNLSCKPEITDFYFTTFDLKRFSSKCLSLLISFLLKLVDFNVVGWQVICQCVGSVRDTSIWIDFNNLRHWDAEVFMKTFWKKLNFTLIQSLWDLEMRKLEWVKGKIRHFWNQTMDPESFKFNNEMGFGLHTCF